jgi:hypothetical protein
MSRPRLIDRYRPPDPAVIAQFDTSLHQLRLRLNRAGVKQIADTVLHDSSGFDVRTNKNLIGVGRVGFAFRIGTSGPNNTIWACSDGSVIKSVHNRQFNRDEQSQVIRGSSVIQFELLERIKWPLALRGDLVTPMGSEIEALMLYDIVRWVEQKKSQSFSNIGNVIFPNADHLIAALNKYGQKEIAQEHSSTGQVASPAPQGRSTGILPTGTPREEGFKRRAVRIPVPLRPKEINHVASEGMIMPLDHTLEEGEVSEQEVVSNNEAETIVDGRLKSGMEITQSFSSTGQIAGPSPQGSSTGIIGIATRPAQGSNNDGLRIQVAHPNEFGHVTPEGMDMSLDRILGVGQILDIDAASYNEVEMGSDGRLEHEEEEDGMPEQTIPESVDESDQDDSSVPHSRTDGVHQASVSRLTIAVGKHLVAVLPKFSDFIFFEQAIEDYLPIRMRIGACRNDKSGILCHLWVYLKERSKRSPVFDYVITGEVIKQNGSVNKHRLSITHEELCQKLNNKIAQLYPIFHPFGVRKQELQALVKYGFILAFETKKFYLQEHFIPINPSFETQLEKVCRRFLSEPVEFKKPRLRLPLQLDGKARTLPTTISKNAAADAEYTGHTDLDKLPSEIREAIDGASNPLAVMESERSGDTPLPEIDMDNAQLELSPDGGLSAEDSQGGFFASAEEVDQEDSVVTPAQCSQANRDRTAHSVDNDSEDITRRPDQHLRTRGAGALPSPDNDIAHVGDKPIDDAGVTQEVDEIMQGVFEDTGHQKSNSPILEHLSSTFRSDGARRDRASPSPDNGDEDTERQESRTPSSGPLPHISPSDTVRNAGVNRRVRSARRSETVRGRGPVRNAREAARKRFAKIQEGRRVIDRRVKKDRKDGNKNLATILNLLVKSEHLRARGNDSFERLAQKNRNLEDLVQGLLQESSHGDSPSREPSFASFSSDEAMDNDNLAGEDDNDVDM